MSDTISTENQHLIIFKTEDNKIKCVKQLLQNLQ